jgi:hypothetical protein
MKSLFSKTKNLGFFAGLLMAAVLTAPAHAEGDGYALLIQSSPPEGGQVSPGIGVHRMSIGQTIALSATPQEGYRFLYWLGDVSTTTDADTSVSVDSPKLVVAVFARKEFDEELPGVGIIDGQFGGGGGRFINPIRSPGGVNPAPREFDGFDFRPPNLPDEPDNDDDIPVPGDNDDIPVPGDNEIPEPATILLLGCGSTILLKRKRK